MWSSKELIIFYAGDGVFVINDDIHVLEKTVDNDYLGHNLLSNASQVIKMRTFNSHNVKSVLLASDGLEYLFEEPWIQNIIFEIFDNQHFMKKELLQKYILDNGNHFDDTTIIAMKNNFST
jgi:hypothetical protein